jgi:predicted phage gp36 major capsid-like protein
MKYGIHPDTLRGKSVDIEELRTEQRRKIEELRDEQKRKIRKIEKVNVTA